MLVLARISLRNNIKANVHFERVHFDCSSKAQQILGICLLPLKSPTTHFHCCEKRSISERNA